MCFVLLLFLFTCWSHIIVFQCSSAKNTLAFTLLITEPLIWIEKNKAWGKLVNVQGVASMNTAFWGSLESLTLAPLAHVSWTFSSNGWTRKDRKTFPSWKHSHALLDHHKRIINYYCTTFGLFKVLKKIAHSKKLCFNLIC